MTKNIVEKLKEKSQNPLIRNNILVKLKEKRSEELRLNKVKVDNTRTKDTRIKNNTGLPQELTVSRSTDGKNWMEHGPH